MNEISVNNIKISYGFNDVLNKVSFNINSGEKVAIVGDNGCGKSTILNIISGMEKADFGTVSIRNKSKIGYLYQMNENMYNDVLVKEILYEGVADILEFENKMKTYEERMCKDPTNINIINKYLNIQDKYISEGGYEINSTIKKVVCGLSINDFVDKKFNELSGGEQKRVLVASLIISKANILLLDEPTNYLDINTIEWLEDYLKNYNGTVIVVSHDRYFLDKITTKTILIENGKAIIFHGNYSYYLKENELRIEREFKDYKDQQKIIKEMRNKIKKLEEFGRLAFPGGEVFYRRAENIKKRLDKLERIEKPIVKKELPINLDYEKRSGRDVLVISNFSLYVENRLLIENINLKINYGEKVCVIGDNGCGKSTLIKNIVNDVSNDIILGSNIKIGYIPQNIIFNEDITVLEYAKRCYVGEECHLRSALNKFYFNNYDVFKRVNKLSGGEKVRLKLFSLIQNNSNFIILDEPTNHIDIYTKETLENALKDYKGTVLFISHDRYFINKIADKILYINNKKIKEYIGNYSYFIDHK